MFLSSPVSENLGLADAAVIALLGYAVVFFGLILLMYVVIALGKAFAAAEAKAASKAADAPAEAPVSAPEAEKPVAPGTAGKLKLYNVEPKTAAMIMAIVADRMGKPINELRFISIKEVKEND